MYVVYSGLQDESLQVTISKLPYGYLHRGHPVNVYLV